MKIWILHASAGHGHYRVAQVIHESLQRRVSAHDLLYMEDALKLTSEPFRSSYPSTYFYSVKYIPKIWGWFYETLDKSWVYRLVQPLRSLNNRFWGHRILKEIKKEQPDVVVCTHFLSSELLSEAKKRNEIKAKILVVITDYFPHSFWVHPNTDYYWVMSEETKKDLIGRGVEAKKILAQGIPVDPQFKRGGRRDQILKKWQMEPNRFTILLTSGSFGLGHQEAILNELAAFKDRVQCFVVCGNNQELFKTLSHKSYSFPVRVFDFVNFMAELMEGSDIVIAKTGGATSTEALAKDIPMIVTEPIPGQETRNAELLKRYNAAFFMHQPEQIRLIMKAIFDNPALIEEKKQAIRSLAKPNAADEIANFILTLKNTPLPQKGV